MVVSLGLSASQKAFRPNVIGGSDANIIMSGDPKAIHRLWQEKRRKIEPENLDGVLQVIMGQWTEPLNRLWFEKQTGRAVTNDGEERLSIDHPIMASTLDGLTDGGLCVFEAKHVGAFWKKPDIIAKYHPQLHHNMIVCELTRAVLSVFIGNHEHVYWDVELDQDYAAELIERESQFWECVKSGVEPVVLPKIETPKEKAQQRHITVNMSLNEEWCENAARWLANKPAADRLGEAADNLKALIDFDVVEAFGGGVTLKVNKANSFTIKPMKKAA